MGKKRNNLRYSTNRTTTRTTVQLTHRVQTQIDSSSKRDVLPGDNSDMFRQECVSANDARADVPHRTFAHLDSHSVGSRRQVTFHSNEVIFSGRYIVGGGGIILRMQND